MAGGNPKAVGGGALDTGAFLAEVGKIGKITAAEVNAVKDNKDQMRAASRAISDLDGILASDPKAANPATQARVFEAIKAAPGHRDIIADFVAKKMANRSLDIGEHSGMVTGRMLGVRPALEATTSITPSFQNAASGRPAPSPGGIEPKNLRQLEVLPTGTDLAEDYNRAKNFLGVMRASATPSEPQESKIPPAQVNEVIASWRRAGFGKYADIMETMRKDAPADPIGALAKAKIALNQAYSGTYEHRTTADVQGDMNRARENALKHLNVDYNDVRSRIPDILREQYGNMSPEQQKTARDQMVKGALEGLTKQGVAITPEVRKGVEQEYRPEFRAA